MFFILVILCFLCAIWKFKCKKQSNLEPPELSGRLPIIGHACIGLEGSANVYKILQNISEECIERGGVTKLNLGPVKFYVVTDPDDCLTTSTCVRKLYVYNFLRPLLGNGIFITDVPTWTKHRKLLNPAFNQRVLDGYIKVFNSQAQRLVERFATELGKPLDHMEILTLNELKTICSTASGVTSDEIGNLQKQYLSLFKEVMSLWNQRALKIWLHNDFIYGKNKSFIDVLLELAKVESSFTDEQIQGEMDTIIFVGHVTVVTNLTYIFTLLGSYPQIQKKAYEEVLHVLGNSDRNVDKNDLTRLVYIEAIIKETLRLYPVTPIIAKNLDKEVKLKNYTLEADTGCIISLYGLHRHKIWGPDVNEFRPERWLDKETLPDPKYYGAFGLGRRSCMGKSYAMMSMKTTVAHVLRKYRITSDVSKMVIEMELMARPKSGFHISLEQRNMQKK